MVKTRDLMAEQITEILEQSILVVAHPDDEILWFSSIADKIHAIVICFMDYRFDPCGFDCGFDYCKNDTFNLDSL